ncbi:MAG: NADH-quinone oxidoreductase subunit J [Chloroflexi bacterium]|nr:NADH-quinone oxidoreductase subunit J [Chloroflexota bacterium]
MEITWQTIAFAAFAVMTLGGGLMVVLSRNLWHSALFLMLSLFGTSGLFVLLVAPFLAAVQVLVYIGAIAILVLFAIMLTRRMMGLEETQNTQWPAAAAVAVVLFGILLVTVSPLVDEEFVTDIFGDKVANLNANLPVDPEAKDSGVVANEDLNIVTVEAIGEALVTRDGFVLPFELASILLTAALIGAIVVAREDEA